MPAKKKTKKKVAKKIIKKTVAKKKIAKKKVAKKATGLVNKAKKKITKKKVAKKATGLVKKAKKKITKTLQATTHTLKDSFDDVMHSLYQANKKPEHGISATGSLSHDEVRKPVYDPFAPRSPQKTSHASNHDTDDDSDGNITW